MFFPLQQFCGGNIVEVQGFFLETIKGTHTHSHIPLAWRQQKEQAVRTDQVWEREKRKQQKQQTKIAQEATSRPQRSEKAHI